MMAAAIPPSPPVAEPGQVPLIAPPMVPPMPQYAAPIAAAPEAAPAVASMDAAPAAAPADAPAARDRRTMGEVLEMAMSLAPDLRERVLRCYMEELNEELGSRKKKKKK